MPCAVTLLKTNLIVSVITLMCKTLLPVHLNFLPLTWLMRLLASLRG